MVQFKIVFLGDEDDEELEADRYSDTKDGKWIDFYKDRQYGSDSVLRVRAEDVDRIERLNE